MKKIVLLGDSIRKGYDKYIKMAFKDVAGRGDGICFNSKSYRIFGKRYYDEYLKIAR